MPRYNPATVEPKWQAYWAEHRTFAAPRLPTGEKLYVLDMFPYPSGDGLHVGHPEGYTATDIVCRFQRMRGRSVLHPMGWDAFGLPAEQHAKRTGTPPRITTEKNIANFRRQLQMLGFSYDWDRELATTDPDYFRWTQWIFLLLFDTWYDAEARRGRPLAELPIPADVAAAGLAAIESYRDDHRLAYQIEAPVNWCPELGTVLANEEVIGGLSERGGYPVVRMPLRQWMLRITAYADRLEEDLKEVDWPEGVKALQRNWIGRSTGAEVDFYIGSGAGAGTVAGVCDPGDNPTRPASQRPATTDPGPASLRPATPGATAGLPSSAAATSALSNFADWKAAREKSGFPRKPADDVLRIYTTRPDTLFGATYMVIAPEHPAVARLTTPEQQPAVAAYCERAAHKSDLDRTDLAKTKTGVFTGSYAVNPVNAERVPIWIADYVLMGYGTGAIMAVPAHDERDFEFAQQFGIPIVAVVQPPSDGSSSHQHTPSPLVGEGGWDAEADQPGEGSPGASGSASSLKSQASSPGATGSARASASPLSSPLTTHCFSGSGTAINSGQYNGLDTATFKQRIAADLAAAGVGRQAVNYKLRDWLFSRQHFWGEPFPILHEVDAAGEPTGRIRALDPAELPLDLPAMTEFKSHGRPEPPLEQAPPDWLYITVDGVRYKRETNTMPQWAGSCWYYLRFIDPKNATAAIDPQLEAAWMPVDLYIGGAEHAVLHLLYSRFWHKVLFDRGVVTTSEPFRKLVNQGMILGEMEFVGYLRRPDGIPSGDGEFVAPEDVVVDSGKIYLRGSNNTIELEQVSVPSKHVVKVDNGYYFESQLGRQRVENRAYKMSKSRGNVVNPDTVVAEYGADSLRLYEMFMGPLEATKPWSMTGVNGVRGFLDRVWRLFINDRIDERNELSGAIDSAPPTADQLRVLHRTIKEVTHDIESLGFNTAIAKMMEFVNYFTKLTPRPRACLEPFVLLLSPFAPHLAEELWQALGHGESLAYEPWPTWDEAAIRETTVEVPVQISGKVRSKIQVAADASRGQLEAAARADERVQELLAGQTVVKVIVVPKRLVNFVLK
ncbi:MAG: leucine--tRNA ligase [Pirellulales bacterium]